MLFIVAAVVIALVLGACLYFILAQDHEAPTIADLNRPLSLDKGYIALASPTSWNDTD